MVFCMHVLGPWKVNVHNENLLQHGDAGNTDVLHA